MLPSFPLVRIFILPAVWTLSTIICLAAGNLAGYNPVLKYCSTIGNFQIQEPTTVSFDTASLYIEYGSSALICLHIQNPSPDRATTAEVVYGGTATRHFPRFQTPTLTFPAGSSAPQCFTLNTSSASNCKGTFWYSFFIQNVRGGNGARKGAITSLNVMVRDETEQEPCCPWAGPDWDLCRGESVLIGCPSGDANPSNYCFRWVPEEGLKTPHQEYSYASPSKTTTYTLYVTDDQGNLIGRDEVTVTIKNEYTASIFPEEAEICPGESVTLEIVLDGNSQNITYLWETGKTTSYIVVQPKYSRSYKVEISDELSGCRETVRQLVHVHNVDMIRPIIEPSVICELPPPGLVPRLPNDVSQAKSEGNCSRNDSWLYVGPLSDGVSISWSTGETGIDNISVYEAGQYSVSITYPSNGCIVVVPFEVTSCVEVAVEPAYSANGEQVLDAGEGYLSYLWHDGSTERTIPIKEGGIYEVTVVAKNGCVGKGRAALPPRPKRN